MVTKDFDSLQENNKVRSELYNFLAMIFTKPPDEQVFQTILEMSFKEFLLELIPNKSLQDEFNEKYSKMVKDFNPENPSEYLSILSNEFHQLFVVPGSKYLIPYESHYFQERTDVAGGIHSKNVSSFYKSVGFVLNQNNTELPDHIGNELAFAGILLKKASFIDKSEGEEDKFLKIYKEFLNEHLILWIPPFCEQLQHKSKSHYFNGWAFFLNQFVSREVRLDNNSKALV